MNELRIGIVGLGYTGKLHLEACRRLENTRVVAVADSAPQTMDQASGDLLKFRDYRELLSLDLDIVHICLPTSLHSQVARGALESGKHVLVEKPIAATVEEAEGMMAVAQKAGRLLYTGMTHRFYPEIRQAKQRVEDGEIGEVVMIRDSIFESVGFLGAPAWYQSKRFAGGGTVLSSGVHLVDRVLWFANKSATSVSLRLEQDARRRSGRHGANVVVLRLLLFRSVDFRVAGQPPSVDLRFGTDRHSREHCCAYMARIIVLRCGRRETVSDL